MALTPEQIEYYKKCVAELNRGMFFGDVQNYVGMMDTEIGRLEALDPAYALIPDADCDAVVLAKPYGAHKSHAIAVADNVEDVVTDKEGIIYRRLNRVSRIRIKARERVDVNDRGENAKIITPKIDFDVNSPRININERVWVNIT